MVDQGLNRLRQRIDALVPDWTIVEDSSCLSCEPGREWTRLGSQRTWSATMRKLLTLPSRALPAAVPLLLLTACNTSGVPLPDIAAEINETLTNEPLTLVVGDRIDVSFPLQPPLSQQVVVRPDGRASFNFGGEMEVAGMNLAELTARIIESYLETNQDVQSEPMVVVNLLESQRDRETGPFVYVIGEVVSPGAVPMDSRELHFIEAISKAGGPLKRTALLQDVVLVRHVRNEKRMSWHIDARIEYWGSEVPIVLQRDDIIFVPNTAIDNVNIWVDQYIRLMIPFPYLLRPL